MFSYFFQKHLLPTLCVVPLAFGSASAATHYDPVKQFSNKSNPGAVWSYLDQSLLPYHFRTYQGITNLDYWTEDNQGSYPPAIVLKNATGQAVTIDNGDVTLPTGYLMLNGSRSIYGAVVRFTAPVAGSYTIKGDFLSLAPDGGKHLVVVYYNNGNNALYHDWIQSGHDRRFKASVTLAAGENMDFFSDSAPGTRPLETGLAVKITGP